VPSMAACTLVTVRVVVVTPETQLVTQPPALLERFEKVTPPSLELCHW